MKTLPLYLGILFVAAAIAAAVAMIAQRRDATGAALVPAPASVTAPRIEPVDEGLSRQELERQDEEDSRKILYAQVGNTQADIDAAWLADMCQYIRNEADLEAFWQEVLERGRKYDVVYEAANRGEHEVLSRLPQVYIFEAREYIHTQVPDADRLRHRVPNLLALAVFRAWTSSVDDEVARQRGRKKSISEMLMSAGQPVVSAEEIALAARREAVIPDQIKSSYLIEATSALELLARLTEAEGDGPHQLTPDLIRLHEVALMEGFTFVKRKAAEARERYSQSASSSAPATVAIDRWQAILDERLLALGKIYVDAALAETTYRGRQQKYADLAFKALAMVYQRTKTGAAITVLREANHIQRYHLWQLGRAAWRQAQLAAKAGNREEAEDQFFTAKQRYLQTLARLERSKQPVILAEYRRLQAEITAFFGARADTVRG